jgi:uncharacterized OB-fold protein
MMAGKSFTKASFDEYLAEEKLMGTRCQECGELFLPPRPMCPECYSGKMEWVEMNNRGTLAAYTIVHIASTAMINAGFGRENPHCSGLVKLEGGQMISVQILGVDGNNPQEVSIGDPVELEIVDRGEGDAAVKALAFRIMKE